MFVLWCLCFLFILCWLWRSRTRSRTPTTVSRCKKRHPWLTAPRGYYDFQGHVIWLLLLPKRLLLFLDQVSRWLQRHTSSAVESFAGAGEWFRGGRWCRFLNSHLSIYSLSNSGQEWKLSGSIARDSYRPFSAKSVSILNASIRVCWFHQLSFGRQNPSLRSENSPWKVFTLCLKVYAGLQCYDETLRFSAELAPLLAV